MWPEVVSLRLFDEIRKVFATEHDVDAGLFLFNSISGCRGGWIVGKGLA